VREAALQSCSKMRKEKGRAQDAASTWPGGGERARDTRALGCSPSISGAQGAETFRCQDQNATIRLPGSTKKPSERVFISQKLPIIFQRGRSPLSLIKEEPA